MASEQWPSAEAAQRAIEAVAGAGTAAEAMHRTIAAASTAGIDADAVQRAVEAATGNAKATDAVQRVLDSVQLSAEYAERLVRIRASAVRRRRLPIAGLSWHDDLQATLAVPTDSIRALNALADADDGPLAEFDEVLAEDDPGAGSTLLSDLLQSLPTLAQRRLMLLALAAIAQVGSVFDTVAGIDQPAHLHMIVGTLWTIAMFLNELSGRHEDAG